MKAVLLHGTNGDSHSGWLQWTKAQLEKLGYEVWVPDLPRADHPDFKRYNQFLLASGWDFKDNLLIGHSSGSKAILALLEGLPDDVKVGSAILIGTYEGDLGREDLVDTAGPFDFPKIKTKAKRFIAIHSDNDPYCPLAGAQRIAKALDAEFILLPGQGHFSRHLDDNYTRFPKLIEIIKDKVLANDQSRTV